MCKLFRHKHSFDCGINIFYNMPTKDLNNLRIDYEYPDSFYKSVYVRFFQCRCGMVTAFEYASHNNGNFKEAMKRSEWLRNKLCNYNIFVPE